MIRIALSLLLCGLLAACSTPPAAQRMPMYSGPALSVPVDPNGFQMPPTAHSDAPMQMYFSGPDGLVMRGPADRATHIERSADGTVLLR